MGNVATGATIGLKNSLGFGEFGEDMLGSQRADLQNISAMTQELIYNQNILAFKGVQEEFKNLYDYMSEQNTLLQNNISFTNELLWEKSSIQDIGILVLFISILFLFFYQVVNVPV